MKRVIFICVATVLAVLGVSTSCQKPYEFSYTLEVDFVQIDPTYAACEECFYVYSTESWEIEVVYRNANDNAWCVPEPATGKGTMMTKLKFDTNFSEEPRHATVYIRTTSGTEITRMIKVVQSGNV